MSLSMESLTGLTLLDPALLWLAVSVPLVLLARRMSGAPAVRFAPAVFAAGLPRTARVRLLPLPRALQALGLCCAVLALARPVRRVPLPPEKEGIDILLCLDVSSSMAETDLDPRRTRLEVAREAAASFVAGRADDRLGLFTFARFPDLLCPLTLDHAALGEILGRVTRVEADGPEDATGIGTAVARAAQTLRGSSARSKVVILLTDGEENVATSETPEEIAPLHAAQLCRELGVRVYVIAAGVGRRDDSGGWVPLDTRQIERLAERTSGAFFGARDAGALAAVYATIDELETVLMPEPRYELRERFLPFLVGAVVLLLAGRVLASSVLAVWP